jgi:hypothetical protein
VISIKKPDWNRERFQSRTVDGRQQLLALVLPLQFGYASLFGDVLQLALGHLELRLEAESIKFPVGHGGVAIRLRGVIWQGLTGRRRRWIPLNKPETEVIVRNKRGSKMNRKGKIDDYYLRCAPPRLPSASSVVRRLLLLAMILGFALIGKRKA